MNLRELAEAAVVALHMHHHGGMNKPLFHECRKDLCGEWHALRENEESENYRLRKILAHVPAKVAIKAKEDAGYGVEVRTI